MKKLELILAGSGGQGLVMMGILLGKAACLDGYHVAQTQSYGIAARGGLSYSEVVAQDSPIVYPKVAFPDLVLALTEESYSLFREKYPAARIAIDADVAIPADDPNTIVLPLSRYCRETGSMRSLNVLATGAVQALTAFLSAESVGAAIKEQFPKAQDENAAAFYAGAAMARSALEGGGK